MRADDRPLAAGYKPDEGEFIAGVERERICRKLIVYGDSDVGHERAKCWELCCETFAKVFARRFGVDVNLDLVFADCRGFCAKEFDAKIHG